MRLERKSAIVTGGGRGIGKAIALAFAREGADVAVAARTVAQLEQTVQEVEALGRVGLAHPVDVTKPADVQALAEAALERFGRIDILVNCAGILEFGRVATYDPADWERVIRVNLIGCFLATQAVLGAMLRARQGRIINIASTAAKQGFPLASAYSASKFAVEGFSQSLAAEVKEHGIRVNTLHPGGVARTAMGRASTARLSAHQAHPPEEQWQPVDALVEPAIFLASAEGADVTGRSVNAREWNAASRGRSV